MDEALGSGPWGDIQGNIAGFLKDHQAFLFVRFGDGQRARDWLREQVEHVATAQEVEAFNRLFKELRKRHGHEGVVLANWMNLGFTHGGLRKLGASEEDLALFPDEFREGMRQRADRIGDVGDNAPAGWVAGLGSGEIDGLIILAADDLDDLYRQVAHQHTLASRFGLAVVFEQRGETRRDEAGHEHFGFKDGISQPSVEGLDEVGPGEETVPLGEFVLGHPRPPIGEPPSPGGYAPPEPEPDPYSAPPWAANGTYAVFRRLRQDVAGFEAFVRSTSDQLRADGDHDLTEALLGAKFVGRYRSGSPLALANGPTDPSRADPSLLRDRINAFDYEDDPEGTNVPRPAHIRKAYPREQVPPGGEEADRRRILRRGIPFGKSFRPDRARPGYGPSDEFPDDRGLLFLCYQASIARQFEFIQSQWVNRADFPQPGDGEDPIISQENPAGGFRLPRPDQVRALTALPRWVRTTGGEYFFQPSISALARLAGRGSAEGAG